MRSASTRAPRDVRLSVALTPFLSDSAAAVVAHVLMHGPTRQADVARALGYKPNRVSKAVDAAVGEHILARDAGELGSPGIGKPSPVLRITPRGRERIEEWRDTCRDLWRLLDAVLLKAP